MPRKKHTPGQIIAKLRQAGVVEAVRQIGATEQTFSRWRIGHCQATITYLLKLTTPLSRYTEKSRDP